MKAEREAEGWKEGVLDSRNSSRPSLPSRSHRRSRCFDQLRCRAKMAMENAEKEEEGEEEEDEEER